ncbi:MAG: hypothetical protein OEV64_04025 [Desulfobulbaceae bacterium]|nr:hypothetical protein [Desulfobulbaceae bacterium]
MKKIAVIISFLFAGVLFNAVLGFGAGLTDGLVQSVANLKIGYHGYVIGTVLNDEQVKFAQKNLVDDPYQGTYKFRDETNTHVVVAKDSNMVLAVYRETNGVDAAAVKEVLAELMGSYGDPTAMAHDKIIYWVYGSSGKVGEEEFTRAKETGKIDALVTVKLNSSQALEAVAKGEMEVTDIYFLISSQPILQEFIAETGE